MIFMFALNRAGGFQIIKKAFVEERDVLPIPPSLRSISASCSKIIDKIPKDSFCRRQFALLGLLFIEFLRLDHGGKGGNQKGKACGLGIGPRWEVLSVLVGSSVGASCQAGLWCSCGHGQRQTVVTFGLS